MGLYVVAAYRGNVEAYIGTMGRGTGTGKHGMTGKTYRYRDVAKLVALTALFTSGAALGNGQVDNVRISKIAVLSGVVLVQTTASSIPGTPACSINGVWHFAFSASDQAMTATVISARINQTPVYLSGGGACVHFSSIEDLAEIQM